MEKPTRENLGSALRDARRRCRRFQTAIAFAASTRRWIDQTSRAAWEGVKPKLSKTSLVVLDALGIKDGTCDEIATRTGLHRDNIKPVVSILRRRFGLVRASGVMRLSAMGGSSIVWTLGQEDWLEPYAGSRENVGSGENQPVDEDAAEQFRAALEDAINLICDVARFPEMRAFVEGQIQNLDCLRRIMVANDIEI